MELLTKTGKEPVWSYVHVGYLHNYYVNCFNNASTYMHYYVPYIRANKFMQEVTCKRLLPPRFTKWSWEKKKQTFKVLNEMYDCFSLCLLSTVLLGEATLMLKFSLRPELLQKDRNCNVLVVSV